jgi:hypothetical protein
MFPSAICRLSVALAASILRAGVGVAQPICAGFDAKFDRAWGS